MANYYEKAKAQAAQLSEWRRAIHRRPELGFQEQHTAALASQILAGLGGRVRTGVGKTGVVADFGSRRPLIAIRADMDALPVTEANVCDYASQNPGLMHACGHDSHVAMACGAARLLTESGFPGSLRVLIQPSEEMNDSEGLSGAPRMIADGAMEGVDKIIALHVEPDTPVGGIRVAAGPFSGGVDSFFATITGTGGHGAAPHTTIDPIHIAAHVILALNAIVSRRLDPFAPAVVSLGSIHAGQAENVIPAQVEINGTIRYMQKAVQAAIHAEIRRAFEISRVFGGDYALKIEVGVPPMLNDAGVVDTIIAAAHALLGPDALLPPQDGLGAEDFGCFSEAAPGAMFSLGCALPGEARHLHSPVFDIDEACLPVGAALLAETALRLMNQ